MKNGHRHQLDCQLLGGAGWQLMTSLPFTVEGDEEPPTIDITQPIPNNEEGTAYLTDKARLTLKGSAADNVGVHSVKWETDQGDSGWADGTEEWTGSDIKLHDGENEFTVYAYDDADNEGTDTLTVIFDNSPPELTIDHGHPAAIKGKPYRLELTATDENDNLREITVDWGDGSPIETFSQDDANVSESEATLSLEHTYENGGLFTWVVATVDEEYEAAVAIQPVLVPDEEIEAIAKKRLNQCGLTYDPIDLTTGGPVLRHTLLSVQGILPIAFEIGYHSLLLKKGPIGRGWEDNRYGAWLEELPTGDVKFHWTTNTYNLFPSDGNGGYQPVEIKCRFDRLVKNPDGSFTLTRQGGSVYQFNSNGRLEQIGNSLGQVLQLSYSIPVKDCRYSCRHGHQVVGEKGSRWY